MQNNSSLVPGQALPLSFNHRYIYAEKAEFQISHAVFQYATLKSWEWAWGQGYICIVSDCIHNLPSGNVFAVSESTRLYSSLEEFEGSDNAEDAIGSYC